MKRTITTQLNAGSMADIAFLLLIFFLVTTTIERDIVISDLLPKPTPNQIPQNRNARDVLEVNINGKDEISVESELVLKDEVAPRVRKFYLNPNDDPSLPTRQLITNALCQLQIESGSDPEVWQQRLETSKIIGDYYEIPSLAIISIENSSDASYQTYIDVQNEIRRAVNELRTEKSIQLFGKPFDELDPGLLEDRQRIKALRHVYPLRISEPGLNN